MTARVVNVTVEARCDGYLCTMFGTVEAASVAHANAAIKAQGWTFGRSAGSPRIYCPKCANDRRRLIDNKILDKDGYVLNSVAYDAYLDAKAGR